MLRGRHWWWMGEGWRRRYWFKPRREVPEQFRGVGKVEAANVLLAGSDLDECLGNVIQVRLGVDTARDGKAHQFEGGINHDARFRRGVGEHDGANLNATNGAFAI